MFLLPPPPARAAGGPPVVKPPIQHVVIIMQENRSFDSYFGTFPGVDGIPAGTCVPLNPAQLGAGCVAPFHDERDVNAGGPHTSIVAQTDLDDGITTAKMDGYLISQTTGPISICKTNPVDPQCYATRDGVQRHDAIGYHTADEIPNYWEYAKNFVLQDRMFEAVRSWSWPSHLELVSEWVARCKDNTNALTCSTELLPGAPTPQTQIPWASLFQLLDVHGISWKYYLATGSEPDCADGQMTCAPTIQSAGIRSYWNMPPLFLYVKNQGAAYLTAHDTPADQFLVDVAQGRLPQVSWLVPTDAYSEHPPAAITTGMEYVTSVINAIMQSPYWNSTAIFLSWDDWGGFYDHVVPPVVDTNLTSTPVQGYGLRVPGLTISAYAESGVVDHALYSTDSYATFIEDVFIGGARLDPAKLGNPDNRPDIRDALTRVSFIDGHSEPIGNLMNEFDFTKPPRPPLVLSTHIPTGLAASCNPPPNMSATCSLPTVTLAWNPVTGPQIPGPFVYHVQRDGVDLSQCAGSATTCSDTPGTGTHFYRAFSVDANGAISPRSAAAEADVP